MHFWRSVLMVNTDRNRNQQKTNRKNCRGCFDLTSNEDLHPSNIAPCLFLILYSFIGAVIYQSIENTSTSVDYWSALFFVLTVYTSIGYGNIYPKTLGGRFFAVIYGIIGIPLTLMVLDNVGRTFATLANIAWVKAHKLFGIILNLVERKVRKRKDQQVTLTVTQHFEDDIPQVLPLWIGILMTIIWFLGCAACFVTLENKLRFRDALYFMFISVMTIGFGDIVPTNLQFTIFYQFLLIVGLSLFSMCISIVEARVDAFTENILRSIVSEFKVSISNNYEDVNDYSTQESIRNHLDGLIKKQPNGKLLKYFLSKNARRTLIAYLDRKMHMRSKGCQTELNTRDADAATFDWVNFTSCEVQTIVTARKWEWLK